MAQRVPMAAIAFAALFCAAFAGATPITTTSFSTWESDLTGSPTEMNFSPISNQTYPSGINLAAVGDPTTVFSLTGPTSEPGELTGNTAGGKTLTGSYIDFAMPSGGESAVVFALTSNSGTITVTLSDGTVMTDPNGVFGFVLNDSITSATITTTGSSVSLSDFFFGTSPLPQDPPTATVEASTFLLTCGGFLVLFGTGRKLYFKNAV